MLHYTYASMFQNSFWYYTHDTLLALIGQILLGTYGNQADTDVTVPYDM